MVADDLAIALAERNVKPGYRVLDPFCGSGRLLIAGAAVPGQFMGVDVNPLACLITMAKVATVTPWSISQITREIECARDKMVPRSLELREQRKVQWYSDSVRAELGQIVSWINKLELGLPERTVVAAALSAAVRDASYCRKGSWKLHRLGPLSRETHAKSTWDCLERRLNLYVAEASKAPPLKGCVSVVQGNASQILAHGSPDSLPMSFDLVVTSPPYGDSKTTVQYGAASALCLDVISQICGFENFFMPGCDIDRQCLGGSRPRTFPAELIGNIKSYWAGSFGGKQAATIAAFLIDFSKVLKHIASVLRPGGRAVLVIGRRLVGGFRLKLDRFAVDYLESLGLRQQSRERRLLREKRLPRTINRFGRAGSEEVRAKGVIRTMSDEYILTFGKPGANETAVGVLPSAPRLSDRLV